MHDGKKSTAEKVVYEALDIASQRGGRDQLDLFEAAIRNAMPVLEVRPRRVGGATYQVPMEVRPERRLALAMRWILGASRGRHGRPMAERLAVELLDTVNGQGTTIKRRDDVHRMAEANRAFAHYRW
jgi:small subunit ribosomal protein S7